MFEKTITRSYYRTSILDKVNPACSFLYIFLGKQTEGKEGDAGPVGAKLLPPVARLTGVTTQSLSKLQVLPSEFLGLLQENLKIPSVVELRPYQDLQNFLGSKQRTEEVTQVTSVRMCYLI